MSLKSFKLWKYSISTMAPAGSHLAYGRHSISDWSQLELTHLANAEEKCSIVKTSSMARAGSKFATSWFRMASKRCLWRSSGTSMICLITIVVKALWNALRGRHKYGATSGNQYAARRCSMITRLTRNLSVTGSSLQWSSNFCTLHYARLWHLCSN